MGKRDPRVDAYIARSAGFAQPILNHLRALVHRGCPEVEETLKWGMPSFTYQGILCGIAAFKNYCTLGFWKHSLLESGGKAQKDAMGQFGRITTLSDLPNDKVLIKLVKEAMALNEAGVKAARKPKPKKPELKAPDYLIKALRRKKNALAEFERFSASGKREYIEWLLDAKTEETRDRRLATAVEWISEGKGRNWKYERK
jgi:uncharacterized protein YdeI (YjbR/CyaY-like superfamily)